ncbi:MAG TPA: cytochrome c biogenesis protein CcdA [Actinomycetota bacterium]|nr:cytochrome c biogenesis protein CcdA [Actinomycetota bacterium]
MADPGALVAFAAGLASFLSPCVLPLVPGYLSYMSGIGTAEDAPQRPLRTAGMAAAFVGGFTVVFVALGATATLLGSFLRDHQEGLTRAGGVLIVAFGLVFMGVLKVPWLYREARWHPRPEAGAWGSVVLGAAFAFGWSPCIGATMGSILAMAAGRGATGGPAEGAALLAVYSLGLGVPFVLAGLGVARLTGAVTWLRRHIRTVNVASGVLLVAVGVLFVTDQVFQLAIWMQKGMRAMGLDFLAEIG